MPAADGGDQSSQIYWAKRQADELVQALKDKERRYFDSAERRGLKAMWIIAYAQYYGLNPNDLGDMSTQGVVRTGPEGKFVRFRVNEVRSFVKQQNVIALGERPNFQCRASNDDAQSVASIEISDNIVQYVYRRANGEEKERLTLEADGAWGAGFGHLRWDADGGDEVEVEQPVTQPVIDPTTGQPQMGPDGQPARQPMTLPDGSPATVTNKKMSGEPYVTVCFPWDVVQDPGAREMNWCIVRERCSKWELAAQFPEHAEKLGAMNILDDEHSLEMLFGLDPHDATSDDCIVKHFYHPHCRAIPGGRYVGVCGDIVLWDGPCPLKRGVPVGELCSGKFACASFGYSDAWDLIAIQEMIDQLCSDTASNLATFGRQVMFYDKGSAFSFDKLAEGLVAFGKTPGSDPPQAVNFAGMPDAVQWFVGYLHERMQSVSGLNSVARGNPDANIRSGEMAALFHSIAIEFQSARQAALVGYRERMANMMLEMVRANAETPFLVELAGEGQRANLQYFTAETLSGVQRVVCETAPAMMRTAAGRLQLFLQLKDKDLSPDERAAAYELIISGRSEKFTKNTTQRSLRVKWENQQLGKGQPVQVLATDNPFEHVPDHTQQLEAYASQPNPDPQIVSAFLQHINDHGVEYLSLNPLLAGFLQIPAPPPMPGTPTAQMAMLSGGGMGAPMGGAGGPPGAAQGGGPPNQQSQPANDNGGAQAQQRDPSGVKLPNPSTPPAGAQLQQAG